MIDTHAHLDFKEFDLDREEAVKRFFASGGEKIINVGCNLPSSRNSVELAKNNNDIFAAVGVHPHDADTADDGVLKELEEMIDSAKVVAVGEVGLDFYRHLSPKEKQIDVFRRQLQMAIRHRRPLVIHCRDAYIELIDILKSYKPSEWRGTVHCFLGSWPIAEQLLDMGFYLGFTGAITYAKKIAFKDSLEMKLDGDPARGDAVEPEIFKVVRNAPLERILVETDCPYLAPVPMRGKRNEPAYVKYVAEKIAEIRGINVEKVEAATSENAKKLFGF